MLYPDVMKVKMEDQAKQKNDGENWVAGATVGMDTAEQGDGFPIDPEAVDPKPGQLHRERDLLRQDVGLPQGNSPT